MRSVRAIVRVVGGGTPPIALPPPALTLALGVDRASRPCNRSVHVELGCWWFVTPGPRGLYGMAQRLEVVGILTFRVIDFVELPQHADEIRLPAH